MDEKYATNDGVASMGPRLKDVEDDAMNKSMRTGYDGFNGATSQGRGRPRQNQLIVDAAQGFNGATSQGRGRPGTG